MPFLQFVIPFLLAVVLIGLVSMSGAESFAGPLQAHRRATLVGECTAGLCGGMRTVDLAAGWRIALAYFANTSIAFVPIKPDPPVIRILIVQLTVQAEVPRPEKRSNNRRF